MNCPSCGAPMHLKADEDSYKCEYCHSVFLPERSDDGVRVLGDPSEQCCPVCNNTPLENAAMGKIRILYCAKCQGMLIPMQVFQTLVDQLHSQQSSTAAQPPADKSDLQRKIGCPQCHHRMDTHFYAGPGNVVIDSCEDCSVIWLDRGELMHIAHAPDVRASETSFDESPAYGSTDY
jgi:Zn-finger nucleic acid-binding protein